MRKVLIALAGATALAAASAANAAVTVVGFGSNTGVTTASVDPLNTNRLLFDTLTTVPSSTGSPTIGYVDFTVTPTSIAKFVAGTSAFDGIVTLLALQPGGGGTVISSVAGSGDTLSFLTGPLSAGVTYRFAYSAALPSGGDVSGNGTFQPAAVPEPATWALMLLGFGGMGMVLRRRRRPILAQVA